MPEESVAGVLIDYCPDTGAEAMIDMVLGSRVPSTLSYKDWVRPMELTLGSVCLRFDRDGGMEYLISTDNGRMAWRFWVDRHDQWCWAWAPPRQVRELLETETPEPVLREDTPFGEDDNA